MKLAPLPLPANPAPFTVVPDPPTVQQEKARARWRGAITSIEALNAVACKINELRVAFRSIDVQMIQSDSRAKCRSPSGLARWWISSRSTCSAMSSGVIKNVGTATSVRNNCGIRREDRDPAAEPRAREA